MLKKKLIASTLITAFVLPVAATAGSKSGGNLGVGAQSSWPSYGLSAKYDINDDVAVQGTVGALGTVSNYGGRVLYKFKKEPKYNLYGFGSVGMYNYSSGIFDESVTGFGGGAGLEYDLGNEFSGTPITMSGEIGLASVGFDNYNYSSFGLGFGIHYWLDK